MFEPTENTINDFIFDTEEEGKREAAVDRKFRVLLILGLIVTFPGILTLLVSIGFMLRGLMSGQDIVGLDIIIYSLCCCNAFMSFLIILKKKKPFAKAICSCVFIMGVLFLIFSLLQFLLPETKRFTVEFFHFKGFFIDGIYFAAGIVLIIFSQILDYGFKYQDRCDLTL